MKDERPHADTDSGVKPRPVAMPEAAREMIRQRNKERVEATVRTLEIDGATWTVRVIGEQTIGHGAFARASLACLRFERSDGGERTDARETLAPVGAFDTLFDEELIELFRSAQIVSSGQAE